MSALQHVVTVWTDAGSFATALENCHRQECLLEQSTGGVPEEEGVGSKRNGPDLTPQGHSPA